MSKMTRREVLALRMAWKVWATRTHQIPRKDLVWYHATLFHISEGSLLVVQGVPQVKKRGPRPPDPPKVADSTALARAKRVGQIFMAGAFSHE